MATVKVFYFNQLQKKILNRKKCRPSGVQKIFHISAAQKAPTKAATSIRCWDQLRACARHTNLRQCGYACGGAHGLEHGIFLFEPSQQRL